MQESLQQWVEKARQNSAILQQREEAARQGLVLPLLARLGWDRDDLNEVVPEFEIGGGRVDYCLRLRQKSMVFIEVKRAIADLDDHERQLLEYAFQDGVEIAVLTNGLVWWLYLPLERGSWEERKFLTIDMQQQEGTTVCQHFSDYLGREAVADGTAVARARTLRASREKERAIQHAIPEAWRTLCTDPDEDLLELFARKVEGLCGHAPEAEELARYLAKTQAAPAHETLSMPPSPIGLPPDTAGYKRMPPLGPEKFTNSKPVAYTFDGVRKPVSSWKELLIRLTGEVYSRHQREFDQVLSLRGRRRHYFSRDERAMKYPEPVAGSGIFVETNLSANRVVKVCRAMLSLFGYGPEHFSIENDLN